MKKIIVIFTLLAITTVSAQFENLPDGWDGVYLENKPAYMNTVTGRISYTKPTKTAKKPTIIKQVDPSIFHKVLKGETLFSISKKYNTTLDKIYSYNIQLTPTNLKEGQEIIVGYDKSKEGTVIEQVVEDLYTTKSNNSQHFVKKGETLYSISKEHGITIEELKVLNGLISDNLELGQKLILKK